MAESAKLDFPTPFVTTAWLAEHLSNSSLRIIDASVTMVPPAQPGGAPSMASGQEEYAKAHIPGAVFADLMGDFSDQNAKLRFMRPSPEQFAAAASKLGIGPSTKIVVYDKASSDWAARVAWQFKANGHDAVAVLEGGWKKWVAEGRPTSDAKVEVQPQTFTGKPRPELFVDRDDVVGYLNKSDVVIINALPSKDFYATSNPRRRPGRIAGSVSLPSGEMFTADGSQVLPMDQLKARAAEVLGKPGRKVTYCGGGIAAATSALLLTALGEKDVAVYDGSLAEWAADPSLPMDVG